MAFSNAAHAEPNAAVDTADQPFRASYRAPESCPGRDEFVKRILRRTDRARLADAEEITHDFDVVIRNTPNTVDGILRVRLPSGESGSRRVTAPSCPAVVDALALAAALTIDPNARMNGSIDPEPEPQPAALPTAAKLLPTSSKPAAADPSNRDVVGDRELEIPVDAQRSTPAFAWKLSLGPALELAGGFAPSPMVVAGGFAEIEAWRQGLLAPAFRLSARHGTEDYSSRRGNAEFRLIDARLEACPLRFAPARSAELRPCAAFEAGRRDVTGRTAIETDARAEAWLAGVALLRLRWFLLESLVLETYGGASFPAARSTVRFDDRVSSESETVHHVPVVAAFAGVGIAARIPLTSEAPSGDRRQLARHTRQ